MLEGLGPMNMEDSSRCRKFDVTARKMAAGIERTTGCDCEIRLSEKGEESCAK